MLYYSYTCTVKRLLWTCVLSTPREWLHISAIQLFSISFLPVLSEYNKQVSSLCVSELHMASLSNSCLVCGHPASPHHHYGAICCYSCRWYTVYRGLRTIILIYLLPRAFFRRSIVQRYECVSGDKQCEVNKITRANCKSCRYDRYGREICVSQL